MYFRLARSRRSVYHPSYAGTLRGAVAEAKRLACFDQAAVSVIYYPPRKAMSEARTLVRVPYSRKQCAVMDPVLLRKLLRKRR